MKLVIGIAILFLAGCDQLKAPAAQTQQPRYQIVSDGQGHVWKVDAVTGDTWMCAFGGTGKVACYAAKHE